MLPAPPVTVSPAWAMTIVLAPTPPPIVEATFAVPLPPVILELPPPGTLPLG